MGEEVTRSDSVQIHGTRRVDLTRVLGGCVCSQRMSHRGEPIELYRYRFDSKPTNKESERGDCMEGGKSCIVEVVGSTSPVLAP